MKANWKWAQQNEIRRLAEEYYIERRERFRKAPERHSLRTTRQLSDAAYALNAYFLSVQDKHHGF